MDRIERLLRALWAAGDGLGLDLLFDEAGQWDGMPDLTGREIDDLLRQAEADQLVEGGRQEGDGSTVWWTNLWLRLPALWALGEWPPYRQEYRPGVWDERYWGRVARPLLKRLADDTTCYVFRPAFGDGAAEHEAWQATRRLQESDLIDGQQDGSGLGNLRITRGGHAVLNPPVDDPLVRARIDLGREARSDAVNAAIEEALRPRIEQLAGRHDIPLVNVSGRGKSLGGLVDELKSRSGLYGEGWRAEITGWLAVRNEVLHGGAAAVSATRIDRLIEGVSEFLESFPLR
jgi:hypothetical protein